MRVSQMLWVTLREDPAEAEIPSHKLLLRAGYIRRVTSGVYVYLPLLWRVLQKISRIVREEMDATGAQECLLSQLQPAELWQESGRWDTYTKSEGIMFSLTDRSNRELGLGPTHEEVITSIARDMIRSYRQLPLSLYQVQTKFRDEIRARFGLLRGREFIMKDAYSFHADEDSLKQTYALMDQAYQNIFTRCGLKFRGVDADSGAIGGSGSQEFMVLADAGEDEVLYTADGKYAANVEKAISLAPDAELSDFATYEKRESPKTETIAQLCQFLDCSPTQVVKNILYDIRYSKKKNGSLLYFDFRLITLVSIRGDQEVNEIKLQNEVSKLLADSTILSLQALDITEMFKVKLPVGYISPELEWERYFQQPTLNSPEDVSKIFGITIGFVNRLCTELPSEADLVENLAYLYKARTDYSTKLNLKGQAVSGEERNALFGSEGLSIKISQWQAILGQGENLELLNFLRIADRTVVELQNFATGANETDYHVVGANWGKDFQLPEHIVDIRKARPGDRAVHDPAQQLESARGIEVGHIFQLGTKYSKAMGANFTNESGEDLPLVMGCYGLGVSRLAQAAVEQSHDKDGIIWNVSIAPYHVIITVPNVNDPAQMEVAEKLYVELNAAGVETLLDDRDERAGLKFKDADLVGIPFRIVTGRSIASGKVELVDRSTKQATELSIESIVEHLKALVG